MELVVAIAQRLDTAVSSAIPDLSRAQASRWIRDGRVRIDDRSEDRPAARVAVGARLTVDVPPPVAPRAQPQDLPLVVVYEDPHLAVVDKPAGMVVHPAPGHADGTLVNALLHHLEGLSSVGGEQRPGLVHRLDRGTSGLLVVAKDDRTHHGLSEQFAAHTAGRIYLAWVHDPPAADTGTVESRLARHPKDRLRYASTDGPRGKRAVTHWTCVVRRGTVGLMRCRLETGRTHQVRVHLTELGCPLVGDGLYVRRGASPVPASIRELVNPSGERPFLHAWQLRFTHPITGEALQFEAPPPPDFQAVADALGIAI